MRGTPSERFWNMVDKDGPRPVWRLGKCWLWTGKKNKDPRGGPPYGRFSITAQDSIQAHRFSYEEIHGLIPAGLVIDHLCRTRLCVRPSHLEAVTPRENVLRQERFGSLTHCPNGHEYTEENTYFSPQLSRQCRKCKTETMRRFNQRNPGRSSLYR